MRGRSGLAQSDMCEENDCSSIGGALCIQLHQQFSNCCLTDVQPNADKFAVDHAMKNISLSHLELHPANPIRRTMPRPPHLRQPDYEQKFDFKTVFYDCFRSAGRRVGASY